MESRRKEQLRGSTSVFFCLTLLLVLSALFTLLEGSRIEGLKAEVRMNSDLVTQSILAEYVTPLWEDYHLFAGNGADSVSIQAMMLGEENLTWQTSEKRGFWMYPLHLKQTNVENYRLLTDNGGEGFYQQAAEYMRQNLAKDAVEAIYGKIKGMQDASEEAGDMEEKVDDAKSCIEQAAKAESDSEGDGGDTTNSKEKTDTESEVWEDGMELENPLEYIGEWRAASILTLLGADVTKLSNKAVDLGDCLEKRKKQAGNWMKKEKEDAWYDRILFQEYLLGQFLTYPTGKKAVNGERQLEYEIEYLIAGKKTDKQNLQSVLERILLLREAANFIYLQTDSKKKGQALSIATLLVGATGNALLVKGVQQGILAVWAFAESVSDVRSLLAGDKIPIVKTAAEWSTDVGALSKETKFQEAEKCKSGLGYEDYLRVLLFLTGKTKLCYRAMDLIEWELQTLEGYDKLRMDMLWDKCSIGYSYEAKPLFLTVASGGYHWEISRRAVYLTD